MRRKIAWFAQVEITKKTTKLFFVQSVGMGYTRVAMVLKMYLKMIGYASHARSLAKKMQDLCHAHCVHKKVE